MVSELPLPPTLDHLHQIFLALNGVYSFLLSQHIQACPSLQSFTSLLELSMSKALARGHKFHICRPPGAM